MLDTTHPIGPFIRKRMPWIAGVLFLFPIAISNAEDQPNPVSEAKELQSKGGIMTLMDSTSKNVIQADDSQERRIRPPLEDCIVLKNEQVSLAIDRTTFSWASMRDETLGIEYVMEPGGPLAQIQLTRLPGAWYQSTQHFSVDGLAARKKTFKLEKNEAGQVLVLSYGDCPVIPLGGTIDIEIRVSLAPQDTVFRWNLSVINRTGLTLENVLFPTAIGFASSSPGSEMTDYVVRGMTSGAKFMNPRGKYAAVEGDSDGPGSTMSIQAVVYGDGKTEGGLYLAAEDSKWFRKNFICNPNPGQKSFSWHFTHFADGREEKCLWTLPYTIAFGPFRGDWYDAAKEYRKWVKTQPVFVPLKDRKVIPEWFTKLNVWFQGQDTGPESENMASMVGNLLRIRKELGEDYGWHWYLWQKGRKHDFNYPDFYPVSGFKEAVATLQDNGVYPMPYINVHPFETQLPMWEQEKASQWAVRNGNYGFFDPTRSVWGRGDYEWVFYLNSENRKYVAMCPATDYWQDKMASISGRLVNDEGVDAVYLDQLMVYPYLCYATNHGHPPSGGGDHMAQGFREMIKKIRAASKEPIILGGENIGEPYTDLIDYQLTAHSECAPERIPFYQAALKDYTVEIGLFSYTATEKTPEAFMAKQGLCLVQGRQLGWFNFNNMDYDHTTNQLKPDALWFMPYLKTLAAARTAAHDFLFYGELLRPPFLKDLPTKNVRWIMWPNGNPAVDDKERAVPVVHAQAYQSPAGDLGLVFSNWTDEDRTVTIEVNQRDWGVVVGQSYQMRTWLNGAWSAPTEQVLGKEITVMVPKLSPLIIQITKKAK